MVAQLNQCESERSLYYSPPLRPCGATGWNHRGCRGPTCGGDGVVADTLKAMTGAGDEFGAAGCWEGTFNFTTSDIAVLAALCLAVGVRRGCLGLSALRRCVSGLGTPRFQ